RLPVGLGLEDRGLLRAFGGEDARLLVALGGLDRGFAVTLGREDHRALLAVGLHLLLHRFLDRRRRIDALEFDSRDTQSPSAGGFVEHTAELTVDGVARGERLLEGHSADDVAERGDGELLDRGDVVADLVDGRLRVRDLEVHDRIDAQRQVVLGDARLRRERDDAFAQIDLRPDAVDEGHQEGELTRRRPVVPAETFDDRGLRLRYQRYRFGHDHHDQCHHHGEHDQSFHPQTPLHTTAVAPSICITVTVVPGSYTSVASSGLAVHTSPSIFTRPECSPTCSRTSACFPGRASIPVGRAGGWEYRRLRIGRTPASSTSEVTAKITASIQTGRSVTAETPPVTSAAPPSISSAKSPVSASPAANATPAINQINAATVTIEPQIGHPGRCPGRGSPVDSSTSMLVPEGRFTGRKFYIFPFSVLLGLPSSPLVKAAETHPFADVRSVIPSPNYGYHPRAFAPRGSVDRPERRRRSDRHRNPCGHHPLPEPPRTRTDDGGRRRGGGRSRSRHGLPAVRHQGRTAGS